MSSDPPEAGFGHAGWDAYWAANPPGARRAYATIASIYRRAFIRPRLESWIGRGFAPGSRLLHAGCGSGEVDARLGRRHRITALDISPEALVRYRVNNPSAEAIVHADLLRGPLPVGGFDGAYNLGVLEHFDPAGITLLLRTLHAAVRPGGRLLVFWPRAQSPSVAVLRLWHRLLERRGGAPLELHPPEPTLLASEAQARDLVAGSGWRLASYDVSPADLLVQAVLLCDREEGDLVPR